MFANTRIDTGTLVDWVIVGGESGHGARPMHPDWARGLRNECTAYDIAFHFKQWGEYVKVEQRHAVPGDVWVLAEGGMTPVPWRPDTAGAEAHQWGPCRDELMRRVGKKTAGRMLDGRTWDEFPDTVGA
jgi:protein gp37